MAKLPVVNEPLRHPEYLWGGGALKINGILYPVLVPKRPSTVVILNPAAIADDLWNAVATGLTGVLDWKLQERNGLDFYYAYVAAPTTYVSCIGGLLQRQTDITQVYVKRVNATDTLTMEFEYWSF